jgi:ribokinase
VFGSIHMDIVVTAPRHPRLGETVMGSGLELFPGGKGSNQAVAASRARAPTSLVARLGDDAYARELRAFLLAEELDLEHTTAVAGERSGIAVIVVAGSENTIVVVPGANGRLDAAAATSTDIGHGDVVVAQLESPQEAALAAFARAREIGALTLLNPAPATALADGLLDASDVIVLNESELAVLSGDADPGPPTVPLRALSAAKALRRFAHQSVVVTLGAAGVVAATPDGDLLVEGLSVDAIDTTGAGDCFVGNLAAGMRAGEPLARALERANLAASLCVQTLGAGVSMPTAAMLDAAGGSGG